MSSFCNLVQYHSIDVDSLSVLFKNKINKYREYTDISFHTHTNITVLPLIIYYIAIHARTGEVAYIA